MLWTPMLRLCLLLSVLALAAVLYGAEGDLKTRWTDRVSPALPHPEYPRPQLVRAGWVNLNGPWSFGLRPRGTSEAPAEPKTIRVPFPPESHLSGLKIAVDPAQEMVYERTFARPKGPRVLLHFGAVDWQAKVYVNDRQVAVHEGGYDPFTVEITGALVGQGAQRLKVVAWDPTDTGPQPRGKQVLKPEGIFYTPTSGIWQTVWLESVPAAYVTELEIRPTNTGFVRIRPIVSGGTAKGWTVVVKDGKRTVATRGRGDKAATLLLPKPRLWSPDSPNLYPVTVKLDSGDRVDGYFAFREVKVAKVAGVNRIVLNGKPLFLNAPLDQGFWPDGLYTAPTDEALRYDLEVTKKLGFNSVRKHVKVEPARWYYWCDKLGLAVMQDMPSMSGFVGSSGPELKLPPERVALYRRELKAMIESFRVFPSIVMWIPFNEGWGQHQTAATAKWVRELDPTRIVNSVSGWWDVKAGDVIDAHIYPGPGMPALEANRGSMLGEFGGLGMVSTGHTWKKDGWGYQSFKTTAELRERAIGLFRNLRVLKGQGLVAAVYTQTTDVETELNGLMTYDREVIKLQGAEFVAAVKALQAPAPITKELVPTARKTKVEWRYTTTDPGEGWHLPGFDAAGWQTGIGGFGTAGTPGAVIGTKWDGPSLWVRRTFTLDQAPKGDVLLSIHHDEDAEVYLDGQPIASLPGFTTDYILVPLKPAAQRLLKPGLHTLAIRCRQTRGGQFLDAGFTLIEEKR